MRVFISWSGENSNKVAVILKTWIPVVLQNAEPYFSTADIDKGTRWSTDIARELEVAKFGVLCVTRDNLNAPWLNFEAGALSKTIDKTKVCPLLFDVKPSDIKDSPILQFQMTSVVKEDVFKLFESMNKSLEDSVDSTVMTRTFDVVWPRIESELAEIQTKTADKAKSSSEVMDSSPLDEILEIARIQLKLMKDPMELIPRDYIASIITSCLVDNPRDRRLVSEIGMIVEDALLEIKRRRTCDKNDEHPETAILLNIAMKSLYSIRNVLTRGNWVAHRNNRRILSDSEYEKGKQEKISDGIFT